MDVAAWLESLGLDQYAQAFADNAVDAAVLPALTADDLKELGVAAVGHRRRLLEAIAALQPAPATTAAGRTLAEGERRQVSVLFADLVGYTELASELDAEEVHALLDAFFQLADRMVAEHGGHVDKHIGDCVMAVFGAPVAHGNDAERAVRRRHRDSGRRCPSCRIESGIDLPCISAWRVARSWPAAPAVRPIASTRSPAIR